MPIWNERIHKKRIEKGITLAQVAEKLGVTEATAQRYERGSIKSIPYEHMCAYGEMLNCSPAYLMGWEDNLTQENADLIPDILSDGVLLEHIKKLMDLSTEHQRTIYDNIAYWYEKEGH